MSQLKGTDFIEKDFLKNYTTGAKEALEVTKELKKMLETKLVDSSKEISLIKPDSVKNIEKFNKSVKESATQIDQLTKVEAKELELQKEISRLKNDKTYQKQVKEVERLRQEKLALNKTTREEVRDERALDKEYERQSRLLNKLRKDYKNVALAKGENSKEAKQLLKQIQPLDKKLKDIDATVGQSQRNVGNYASALGGLGGKIKGLLAVGGIVTLGKQFLDANRVFRTTQQTVKTLFGGTKSELKLITSQSLAFSKAWDKDVNETLRTANTLSKQFGLTGANALKLIEEGFTKGADADGQFLDNLREYSPLLELAGLTAEQSIAVITQQVKEGVFSDKGVDAIKEATLSLREMTPAAELALKSIGVSAKQIQKEIKEGTKTYFDVIQDISKKTKEFGEDSKEAGLILADVFKGAGEDAGDFIFKLGDINTSLEDMEDVLTDTDKSMIEISKNWSSFVTNVSEGKGVIGAVFSSILGLVDDLIYGLKRLSQSDEDRLGILISERELKKSKERVEDFNSFVKKLRKDTAEDRTNEQLAKSFLATDKEVVKQLRSLDNLTDKQKIRLAGLEAGIKAVELSLTRLDEKTNKTDVKLNESKQKQLTQLDKLQKKLKETNEEREVLLKNPEDALTPKFQDLTEEAKKLKEEIELLQNILSGKKRDKIELDFVESKDSDILDKRKEGINEEISLVEDGADAEIEIEKDKYEQLNQLADLQAEAQRRRADERMRLIDEEIQASKDREASLLRIAEQGNLSASQSLAEEQKRQAELNLKREKELQKQKAIEAGLALLRTYTNALGQQGATPISAFGTTAFTATALTGLINALPSFEVGTESLNKVGNGVDGKGGRLIIAHDEERIVPKKINAHLDGIANSELPMLADIYRSGLIQPTLKVDSWQSNEQIISKFDELKSEIKQLNKVERYDYDNISNTLIKQLRSGNRVVNQSTKKSSLW